MINGSQVVKCRKPHICHGCRSKIEVGEYAARSVSVDGGKIVTAYWCEICQKVMSEMDSYDLQDGIMFGELIDNMMEYWLKAKEEIDGTVHKRRIK